MPEVKVASTYASPASEEQSASSVFDEWLERPLINPWSEITSHRMTWYKSLIRKDYTAAEAIWAGVLCSVIVTVGINVMRAYIWLLDVFPAHADVQSCAVVTCVQSASSMYDTWYTIL